MTTKAEIVEHLLLHYFYGWQEGDWDKLRGTLAATVLFEQPGAQSVEGADAHVAMYADRMRFPDLSGIALRRMAFNDDVAFVSYDAYLGDRRTITVVDQLSVRDGQIVHVLSVSSEWPASSAATGS